MSQLTNDVPEGILLVDKPQGITSHDVVSKMRRVFHMKKVGHAGTLDPMATGMLLILIGKATKASQYLMSMDKEYVGRVKLGVITDSQDADGEVTEERAVPALSEEQVKAEMKTFIGDQYQTPPMFSAKKINGQKLYKLARQGKTVAREPRVIHISRFDMTKFELPEVSFIVGTSKGAYVRTIANDLGERLGCGGHLNELRRTAVGQFRIEKASTIEALENMSPSTLRKQLIPVIQAVPSHAL
ncbi:tRNA pseudouridine(55) synthase TruB [Coraliomargarita sp. SDUM461004]|uniref:tRNA pseudouridine synthase B n=1 Tax=Thalassobacterium sedimentorum TaxID=3041258 RepID=A0ABU1AHR3_9BACT|nr:tRNA pseudouridine(55) synthase TruB [Coraliomargarita sp. SDUM461004]MDQ8194360.1 tRNA pseudouridine(55) synthase TruB [Coraliomargarita sp. SDUM461004]